jgi:dimethylargininase
MSFISKRAIIREIPNSFKNCITTQVNEVPIDIDKARVQHQNYCEILESLGLQLIRLEAIEALPDCCFTEDTAIVLDEIAIIANPVMSSRSGELQAIVEVLESYRELFHLKSPAHLDGGDVVQIDKKLFIGLSDRTNREAINQVKNWVKDVGYEVVSVPVKNTLHLKSACTYIGQGTVLLSPENVDPQFFSEYQIIKVPPDESYCADALAVGETVLIPSGYPDTKAKILSQGFNVITLDTSEIKKADGALTCMSVIFRV